MAVLSPQNCLLLERMDTNLSPRFYSADITIMAIFFERHGLSGKRIAASKGSSKTHEYYAGGGSSSSVKQIQESHRGPEPAPSGDHCDRRSRMTMQPQCWPRAQATYARQARHPLLSRTPACRLPTYLRAVPQLGSLVHQPPSQKAEPKDARRRFPRIGNLVDRQEA